MRTTATAVASEPQFLINADSGSISEPNHSRLLIKDLYDIWGIFDFNKCIPLCLDFFFLLLYLQRHGTTYDKSYTIITQPVFSLTIKQSSLKKSKNLTLFLFAGVIIPAKICPFNFTGHSEEDRTLLLKSQRYYQSTGHSTRERGKKKYVSLVKTKPQEICTNMSNVFKFQRLF